MSRHNSSAFVFLKGIKRAKSLCGVFTHSQRHFPKALDCSDILRSALVTGFSALDLLVHSITKDEILYRYRSRVHVRRLVVPFNFFLADSGELLNALEMHISDSHGHKSFMAPEKIAEVLSYFVDDPWKRVADKIGQPEASVKGQLRELVRWRNRIVHEQDINPLYGGIELWPIHVEDVHHALNFLDILGPKLAEMLAESA